MKHKILSFIGDNKRVRIRLALTFTVMAIAFASGGSAQAKPSAGAYSGCTNPADQTDIPEAECLALVALYDSTTGASWTINTDWKSTDTPCSWYGVACTSGNVTNLILQGNNLAGSIPTMLGNLSNLTHLFLCCNGLSGTIPTALGDLSSLTQLTLHMNSLTGVIPVELGNLSNLTDLVLRNNSLTGSIPAELNQLTNLHHLVLNNNSLTGSIPTELGMLSNLTELRLDFNSLSGSIPAELGDISNLTQLGLMNNNLTGSIPAKLGNLTNLQVLYINDNNGLSGWLPQNLTNISGLIWFWSYSTELCEPPNTAFQNWLTGIFSMKSTGVTCMPFLDLPIAYTNFSTSANGNIGNNPGLVNSWFDHNPTGQTVQTWTSILYTGYTETYFKTCDRRSCYDGHNGIDFQKQSDADPIYPAYTGKIAEVCQSYPCSRGGSYGNYVLVDHENGYATFYAHLASVTTGLDVDVPITDLSSQIGIMGGTGGWPVHLHFGLYYDMNGDGNWTEDEVVDPYGWLGSPGSDPWNVPSTYLWLSDLNTNNLIDSTGGNYSTPSGYATVDIPVDAVSSALTLEMWDAPPIAAASAQLRSTGNSFWMRVLEWLGLGMSSGLSETAAVVSFDLPVTVSVDYQPDWNPHLDYTLGILYQWDESATAWAALTTTIDTGIDRASAPTSNAGYFDLQAPLVCPADVLEPNDDFNSSGSLQTDGTPISNLFDIPLDEDWYLISANAYTTYIFNTTNLSAGVKTLIQVFDNDGVTILASDDNSGDGLASSLEWTAPLDANYFIRVSQAGGSSNGCSAGYDVSATIISTVIFTDGFESGDFSAWDAAKKGSGDLKVCGRAAINGSYGMCVKNKTNNTKFVTDNGLNETSYSAQFNLDPNGLNLQNKKVVRVFQAKMGKKSTHWVQFRKLNGAFQVRAMAKLDDGTKLKTNWFTITNAAHLIEVDWSAATGAGNNDGVLQLYIDDVLKQELTGMDTDTLIVNQIRLGFTNNPRRFSVRGVFFIDDFKSSDTGYIGH